MTGMRKAAVAVVVVGLLVGGGLVACTGSDSDPGPGPRPSAGSSAGASAGSGAQSAAAQKVTEQYLGSPAAPTELASVKGTVRDGRGNDVPGTLSVLAVDAGEKSTAVRWKLASDEPIRSVSTNYYNRDGRAIPDTSKVVLIAKSENEKLSPSNWLGDVPSAQECTCAYSPGSLGPEGVELSSLYPVLPTAATEVELRVPGFPAVSAPVKRS